MDTVPLDQIHDVREMLSHTNPQRYTELHYTYVGTSEAQRHTASVILYH